MRFGFLPGFRILTSVGRLHILGIHLFTKQTLKSAVCHAVIELSMLMRNSLCMPSGSGAFSGLTDLQAITTSLYDKEFWRCSFSFSISASLCFSSLLTFLVSVLSGFLKILLFTTCLAISSGDRGQGCFFFVLPVIQLTSCQAFREEWVKSMLVTESIHRSSRFALNRLVRAEADVGADSGLLAD